MQQRRVRLGDVLDDYCPRERRITNHAVVAMIEDDVKQTRCTTCDAEHEYKHAKIPSPRRKKPVGAVAAPPVEATDSVLVVADAETDAGEPLDETVDEVPVRSAEIPASANEPEPVEGEELEPSVADDEWPVHRPLIRATLPRPEGQAPERKPTDFTIRQSGSRFDGQRNGNKSRGNRQGRQAQGGQASGQSRFGSSRHGSRHGGGQQTGNQQQRHGNRQGSSGQRGGRPGQGGGGHNRGGQNRGPKRGR
jgi:translation initiation factor IF-2